MGAFKGMYPDFGYMEEGRLGKAYDFGLVKRLIPFLKPYGRWIGLSLLLVLFMAVLDLLIPYFTKEAIDRHIVVSARELVLGRGEPEIEASVLARYGAWLLPREEKGKFFLMPEDFQAIDRKEVARLQRSGLLTERRYYVFSPRGPEDEELLRKHASQFERAGSAWFISFENLKGMSPGDLVALRRGDIEGLLHLAFLVLLILIVHFGLNFIQVYTMEVAGQRVMHDLRMKLFSHVQSLSISFFDKSPVGRLVTRLTNDIQNIQEMFTSVLLYLFKDFLLVIGIVVVLLRLNRSFALVSFSVLPLIFITTLLFSQRARDAFREVRLRVAEMNAFFHENFSGIKVVQLFQRQAENGRRFGKINEAHYLANMKQLSVFALFVPLVEVLSSGAIGLLLWYGGGKVIQESITLGVLVAFFSYMRMFFQPIRDLSEKYTILQSAMASLERIFHLFDRNEKLSAPLSPQKREVLGKVEFRDVSFSYDGNETVLRGVSFTVEKGETVAIVGPTGAGKTSLIHLLERFYDVEKGQILVDGIDVREWELSHLRSQMGLVMQDTFLFSGSIEENIKLGDRASDGARARDVARVVNAAAFVERLRDGFRTEVGEGGVKLSAGEMQLLAFARALYVDPKILILDEATSHIDPETEKLIEEGLAELFEGRTAIVIAHRLSTIKRARRIIVLHKGKVREIGSHSELMAKQGLYYKLYQLQYGRRGQDPG